MFNKHYVPENKLVVPNIREIVAAKLAVLTDVERSSLVDCDKCGGTGIVQLNPTKRNKQGIVKCTNCRSVSWGDPSVPEGKIKVERLVRTYALDRLEEIHIYGIPRWEVEKKINRQYFAKRGTVYRIMTAIELGVDL